MRPVTLNLGGIKDPQVVAALNEIQRASQDTLQNDPSSSGNAMATLIGAAADQIAYFTSQYTTAYAALTAFGRTLIGAADGPTALATLGVGPVTREATKSDQQAGTSDTLAVTPHHQQDHDSAAKFWIIGDASGAILASFNVASVTKNGTGDFTVTFTTPFASANYATVATLEQSAISNGLIEIKNASGRAAGSIRILCVALAGSLFDPASWSVAGFGRQ